MKSAEPRAATAAVSATEMCRRRTINVRGAALGARSQGSVEWGYRTGTAASSSAFCFAIAPHVTQLSPRVFVSGGVHWLLVNSRCVHHSV